MEWIDPPPPHRTYFDEAVRSELRANPGKWACIARGKSSPNGGLSRRYPEYQFTSRSHNDQHDVYARYVGPSEVAS
jgi:hypothetical protein